MKIYNVQILRDINNNYQGLDDTKVYTYADKEQAMKKLSFECEKAIEFLTEDTPIEYINMDKKELEFSVDNDHDYIHGRIIEEANITVFAITTVDVEPYDPAAISTYFRRSKEEADKEYKKIKEDFFESIKEHHLDENETLEDFIIDHVQHDYEFANGNRYFHCVYGEGKEFVINMEGAN